MATVNLTKPQFLALVALNMIALAGIFASFYSGIEDRAIIKVRLNDVLTNISQGEQIQTVTLNEIKDQEQARENRSLTNRAVQNETLDKIQNLQNEILYFEQAAENRTKTLLPGFEDLLNDVNQTGSWRYNISQQNQEILENQEKIIGLFNGSK